MGQDRFSSMLLSMCLHLGIVALVLLWPLPEPKLKDFKPPLVTGLVTFKGNGKPLPNSKAMQSQASKATEKPTAQKQEEPTLPEPPQTPPVQENPLAEVPQKPEVKPLEKVEPPKPELPKVEPPKPEPPKPEPPKETPPPVEPPKLDPSAIKVPKEDAKKPPQKNATAQKPPEKEVKKPEEPKKEPVKTAETKKAEEKKPDTKKADAKGAKKSRVAQDILDLKKGLKDDSPTAKGSGKKAGGKSAADIAADELRGEVGSEEDGDGTGPGDAGGIGVGSVGPYEAIIVQSVKPNWNLIKGVDRRVLSAVINMTVEPDGTISQARIVQSSGNRLFDSSLMTAIQVTGVLNEPPPTKQRVNADVVFEQ